MSRSLTLVVIIPDHVFDANVQNKVLRNSFFFFNKMAAYYFVVRVILYLKFSLLLNNNVSKRKRSTSLSIYINISFQKFIWIVLFDLGHSDIFMSQPAVCLDKILYFIVQVNCVYFI